MSYSRDNDIDRFERLEREYHDRDREDIVHKYVVLKASYDRDIDHFMNYYESQIDDLVNRLNKSDKFRFCDIYEAFEELIRDLSEPVLCIISRYEDDHLDYNEMPINIEDFVPILRVLYFAYVLYENELPERITEYKDKITRFLRNILKDNYYNLLRDLRISFK